MEKTNTAIINDMIDSNMLDFGMELDTVRGVIEQMKNEEISSGFEVNYDVNELVEEYSRINSRH